MKTQIASEETNLPTSYFLISLLFSIPGILLILEYYNIFGCTTWNNENSLLGGLIFLLFGITIFTLSNIYAPHCCKLEVDENYIYVTKSEYIISHKIEKTIKLNKNSIKEVSKSTFLGFRNFGNEKSVYYIEFYDETEFGKSIAILSNLKLKKADFYNQI